MSDWFPAAKRHEKDLLKTDWESYYEAFVNYRETNGHGWVPSRFGVTEDGIELGAWIGKQRLEYRKAAQGLENELNSERIRMLSAIDFEWIEGNKSHPQEEQWESKYRALAKYAKQNGHARVPAAFVTEDGINLGRWVGTQRDEYFRRQMGLTHHLSPERIRKLNAIGFSWYRGVSHDERWESKYQTLIEFKEQHGHARVPCNFVTDDGVNLGAWASNQRQEYRKREEGLPNAMSSERLQRLEEINFEWVLSIGLPTQDIWNHNFSDMCEFKEKHGHTRVPRTFVSDFGLNLGIWGSRQRQEYSKCQKGVKSTLTAERIQLLNGIGFEWVVHPRQTQDDKWEAKYKALITFQQQNGHTCVPSAYKTDDGTGLGAWVSAQRREYKRRKSGEKTYLTTERVEKLNKIKFQWTSKIEDGDLFEI